MTAMRAMSMSAATTLEASPSAIAATVSGPNAPGWLVTSGGNPSGQILSLRADAIHAAKKIAAASSPSKLVIRDEAGDITEEILFDVG